MTGRVMYLHGLPGSAAELHAALGGRDFPAHLTVLDRLVGEGIGYREALLSVFDQAATGETQTLVAFSLGAMSALQLAAARPEMVGKVILVSPAAPLELGDFLPAMAGQVVFRAAQGGRWPLRALSTMQGLAMRFAPDALVSGMFAGTSPAERELASRPDFRMALTGSLQHCLHRRRPQYMRELAAYVSKWSSCLNGVFADVSIWHGDADTWVPLAMSQALTTRTRGKVELSVCPGLGHFSTLHHVAPIIMDAA